MSFCFLTGENITSWLALRACYHFACDVSNFHFICGKLAPCYFIHRSLKGAEAFAEIGLWPIFPDCFCECLSDSWSCSYVFHWFGNLFHHYEAAFDVSWVLHKFELSLGRFSVSPPLICDSPELAFLQAFAELLESTNLFSEKSPWLNALYLYQIMRNHYVFYCSSCYNSI